MEDAGIYAREVPSLDRWVQVGVAGGRLLSVSFPGTPDEGATGDHELLDRIARYLDGERDEFRDVAVALTVPTDQRAVLETLREIPYGETVTVERLAGMTPRLDDEEGDDRRVVRAALAANPAPLVLPDHRVEDADGATPGEVAARLRALESGEES